jgi:hypothetical protein
MKELAVMVIVAATAISISCTAAVASVQLRAERNSVVHVGQMAALSVPSDRHFSVGSAGTALVLVKQEQHSGNTVYVYRAAEVGNHTFVATPGDPGPDGCISCVTVHFFVNVVQ